MILTLKNTLNDIRVINKVFENKTLSLNIRIRRDFNMMSPSLLLSDEVLNNSILNYNYASIDCFNRSYFINEVINMGGSRYVLSLKTDLLTTYKNEILSSKSKFLRKIEAGDLIDLETTKSLKYTSTKYVSDKGFDGVDSMILTSLG